MVKIIEFNATEQLPQVVHVIYTKNQHEDKGRRKWFQNITNTQIFIGIAVMIYLTAAITYLAFISITGIRVSNNTTEESSTEFVSKDITNTDNISGGTKFITRREWLATPARNGVNALQVPVPYVVIHHTAAEGCTTFSECKEQVRVIQNYHMDSNGWADIGYNFLIGGDGYIFQGRGWDKLGAHVKSFNNVSIGIAFIGLFEDKLPSNASLSAAQELLKTGVIDGYIKEDYKLFGMRQLSKFNSPGQKLYELIKSWPHWSYTL